MKFAQLIENESLYNDQTIKFKLQSREQRYNKNLRPEKFSPRSDNNEAINSIMEVMKHISIHPMQLGIKKKETCKFNTLQIHSLIVLMPFFLIRNTSQYPGSSLGRLFSFEKDMFYRFMNNRNVRWCKLLYAMNLQLLRKINKETKAYDDKSVCLVIDDTDAPKTDRKSEFLSRIFSHGQHRSILEYKCLTM